MAKTSKSAREPVSVNLSPKAIAKKGSADRAPKKLQPAVVVHCSSTPYDPESSFKTTYASTDEANAVVMKHWEDYKSGYELEVCKLYKNAQGFLKFVMVDQEGSKDVYYSAPLDSNQWVLIEEGDSAQGCDRGI